jgi:hypothetical protein
LNAVSALLPDQRSFSFIGPCCHRCKEITVADRIIQLALVYCLFAFVLPLFVQWWRGPIAMLIATVLELGFIVLLYSQLYEHLLPSLDKAPPEGSEARGEWVVGVSFGIALLWLFLPGAAALFGCWLAMMSALRQAVMKWARRKPRGDDAGSAPL